MARLSLRNGVAAVTGHRDEHRIAITDLRSEIRRKPHLIRKVGHDEDLAFRDRKLGARTVRPGDCVELCSMSTQTGTYCCWPIDGCTVTECDELAWPVG